MAALDYKAAHRFVDNNPNVRWEGWDMIIFKDSPAAASKVDGRYHNGKWGFESRISVDNDGRWRVPTRNARYPS